MVPHMTKDELLDKMIRDTKRLIHKMEQLVRDIEWWNANRTDAEPFDVGRDKATVHFLQKHLAELESRPRPGELDGKNMGRAMELLQGEEEE